MTYRGDNIYYSLGNDTIEYTQNIQEAGYYNIYVYNPKFSNATQYAPYLVGDDTFYVNQKDPESSGWRRLTTKHLEIGDQVIVKVHSNASDSKPVLADDVIALINRNSYLENNPESNIEPLLEPKNFELGNNYPNPFNPSTTLPYSLNNGSYIHIDLIDLNGKKVKNLFSGYRDAGNYELYIDGQNLSAGIYFVTLYDYSGRLETQKILLLK